MQNNSSETGKGGKNPEIDVEQYRNGSRVVTPSEPLPESSRERRDGPGGE